jgi:hypothetical protein
LVLVVLDPPKNCTSAAVWPAVRGWNHPVVKVLRLRGRWREEVPATAWRWLLLPAWLVFRPLVENAA